MGIQLVTANKINEELSHLSIFRGVMMLKQLVAANKINEELLHPILILGDMNMNQLL